MFWLPACHTCMRCLQYKLGKSLGPPCHSGSTPYAPGRGHWMNQRGQFLGSSTGACVASQGAPVHWHVFRVAQPLGPGADEPLVGSSWGPRALSLVYMFKCVKGSIWLVCPTPLTRKDRFVDQLAGQVCC